MADLRDVYRMVESGDSESAFQTLAAIKGIDPVQFPDLTEGIRQEIVDLEKQIETQKRMAFKMKIYEIKRHEGTVVVEVRDTREKEVYPLVHVGYHGNGFDYGRNGSGPADLAWSILANFLQESNLTPKEQRAGEFVSHRLHQKFKEDFIMPLDPVLDEHVIYEVEIILWFTTNFPALNIQDYRQRRDEYRSAVKRLEELETKFDKTDEGYDEVKDEWDTLEKIHEDYITWFYSLEIKHV